MQEEYVSQQPQSDIRPPVRPRRKRGNNVLFILVTVIFIAIIIAVVVYLRKSPEAPSFEQVPPQEMQLDDKELGKVLGRIGKHILLPVLPEGSEPQAIELTDAEVLATEQQFFVGSIDGDILLLFPGKAIIYSPSRDILVNVGPVVLNDESSVQPQEMPVIQEEVGVEEAQ